jgi:hypothetical protein
MGILSADARELMKQTTKPAKIRFFLIAMDKTLRKGVLLKFSRGSPARPQLCDQCNGVLETLKPARSDELSAAEAWLENDCPPPRQQSFA